MAGLPGELNIESGTAAAAAAEGSARSSINSPLILALTTMSSLHPLTAKLLKQFTPSPATLRRPILRPGHWREDYHSPKPHWIVTRHENQGIYVKRSWAMDVEGPNIMLQLAATMREALYRMAEVCAHEHATDCRIRNNGRLLTPWEEIPNQHQQPIATNYDSEDATIDTVFMAELEAAETKYGIVPGQRRGRQRGIPICTLKSCDSILTAYEKSTPSPARQATGWALPLLSLRRSPRRHPMPAPKKRKYDLDLPKLGTTSAAPPAPSRNAQTLTEITRINTDGTVRHDNRMAPVPTSSVSKGNEVPLLLPDGPVEAPKGAPVYDLYEQGPDDLADDAPFLEDVPREMRDSDYPLKEWVKDEDDTWLEELLRAEGRGDHRSYSVCPRCKIQTDEFIAVPMYRSGPERCSSGLRSKIWGSGFNWVTGIPQTQAALPLTRRPGEAFVIVGSDGVHEVALDFCGCGPGGPSPGSSCGLGYIRATGVNPRTAATFAILRQFHLLSLESKISAYEFYNSLARGTNNTGIEPLAKMLKRAGRGHDPTGTMGTAPGECALLCPACPQPGKNLPENWESIPESVKFIYALFLAWTPISVSSARMSPARSPILDSAADGLFCDVSTYIAHLADNWDNPQECSTCVAHDAVDQPDWEARGTASSGIGAVDCARHNMKRPNGVGDLQLGERYINMDYMFFRSIVGTELQRFYVSYDIACQWHKNIWARMEDYSPEIHYFPDGKFMSFLVPKFHLPVHIETCNLRFSFNLRRNVGQTDGEAPERGWVNTNPLASSTKKMGPGARRDALDDHFNDWNYKKILAFGRAMLKKMENTVPQMVEKKAVLAEMEASLAAASGALEEGPVEAWTAMAEKWEEDPDAPNPFETMSKEDHVARVQHDLAVEAADRGARGENVEGEVREDMHITEMIAMGAPWVSKAADREARGENVEGEVREDMHITEMIVMGLQLEEHQRTLGFDTAATGLHPTTNQRRAMVERTSKLRWKIVAWMDIQNGFFPSVKVLRSKEDEARARIARTQPIPGLKVHELKLWLPSALMKLPGVSRGMAMLQGESVQYKYSLRVGQAMEAVDEIRQQFLVRMRLHKRKDANVRGVRDNMRLKSALNTLDNRVRRMATQYRVARRALETLGDAAGDPWRPGEVAWGYTEGVEAATLQEIEEERRAGGDVVNLGSAGGPREPSGTLRIEWAKARARALHWMEEVDLLEEEMRRIRQFLTWRAAWWRARADGRGREQDGPQREGERVYAYRQAKLQDDLCANFAAKWAHLPELVRKGRAGELDVLPSGRKGSDDEGSEDDDSDDAARPVPRSSKVPIDPLDLE
ncbi:hypothetical protein B0H16DRAFT_1468065 [Mycena metata]|uniref:CxC2-like cysteine cluster KDZ transposase-associated domain-containing protein n=1 Tax=Mycena metata TaxID=1033252 RepID=A0AAD7I2F0_9AGAR|nr:hypothetical protein B0H16DRAFT_1468065 [Mycena metata]